MSNHTKDKTYNGVRWKFTKGLLVKQPDGDYVAYEDYEKLEQQRDELLSALKDATNNCLWRSDLPFPLSKEESQRIFDKAIKAIASVETSPHYEVKV